MQITLIHPRETSLRHAPTQRAAIIKNILINPNYSNKLDQPCRAWYDTNVPTERVLAVLPMSTPETLWYGSVSYGVRRQFLPGRKTGRVYDFFPAVCAVNARSGKRNRRARMATSVHGGTSLHASCGGFNSRRAHWGRSSFRVRRTAAVSWSAANSTALPSICSRPEWRRAVLLLPLHSAPSL